MMRAVYLMSGPAHLPYLVVSLYHLRHSAGWNGPVEVHAWAESHDFVQQVANDRDLDIQPFLREPTYRGKNGQFLDKIRLMQRANNLPALYLDADTMPVQSLDEFGPALEKSGNTGFVATQFNKWHTQGSIIKKRISKLYSIDFPTALIDRTLESSSPSVNGGVFAAWPWSPLLRTWEMCTDKFKLDMFIADEVILHPMMFKYPDVQIMCGGAYNCSPKHKPPDLDESAVRIWHFHGDANVRPQKSQRGFDLWFPEYLHCLDNNVGNINNWIDGIRNKYLDRVKHYECDRATRTKTKSI